MASTHTTPTAQTFVIQAGLTVRPSGTTVQCDDCGAWEHLDGVPRIRHTSRCDTGDLQVARVEEPAPTALAPETTANRAPAHVEECLECGATYRTAGNVWDSGMCCRRCR
jgi:hypothetical protein